MTSSASSIRGRENNPMEPLYQVKLLSALRSGDTTIIHPFLTEIGKERRKSAEGEADLAAAALHLAIRCASAETVLLLLSHRAISPNGIYPQGSGTTPLHLAASLGRADIVNLLLEQEGIDDSLRDANGKNCKDVAKGKDVLRAIEDSRSLLNASYRSLLRTYILSPPTSKPHPTLLAVLESPRVRFVNLSYLDDSSGTSLLHEAAKRKDLRLIELAVRAGADVFVRDRKGRMAYDGAGKDDKVRVFLRQFANHDTTLINDAPISEPPTLKGYLNKYTNVARGYNTRWFVLKNGVLSYYRHQEDETVTSRGSISMKTAILKVAPGGDKYRFEVHSTPSRGHNSGVQKWYMKANHPVEAHRWTQAVGKNIQWYKNDDSESRKSMDSDSNSLRPTLHRAGVSSTLLHRSPERGSAFSSVEGIGDEDDYRECGGSSRANLLDPRDEEGNDDSSAAESTERDRTPPHEDTFELHGNSTTAQLELTSQLLSKLTLPPDTPAGTQELGTALKDAFSIIQGMMNQYVEMSKERDEWWRTKLERERDRQKVWEESLQFVVKEGEDLEKELRNKSRRRGSRFFDASIGDGRGTVREHKQPHPGLPSFAVAEKEESPYFSQGTPTESGDKTDDGMTSPLPTPTAQSQREQNATSSHIKCPDDENIDTDDEDEFFDAIESNTLPNLVIHDSLKSSTHPETLISPEYNTGAYTGYKDLRRQLLISSDDRPSTSLWSVLKHSIGKDLTKISFPVFFNEPTSMLQRMAEDMEFSECLDVAAREEHPHRRIAFVAAFAMSNYSSTIGRIAKPFNPMLSETFEYVRFDKEYRYISEQVSHHPPISACWAESPLWHYYGEVDAQNKFMGKSFEIRPTGVAHADLILPEQLGPDYPRAKGKAGECNVIEHYSWKKVTTNVSGFILGSPTIDHYGDMIITNHRTQDKCILTFKPRGWRGKDAYEISGVVKDSAGNVTYEIAGRWNSQLIARAVGAGSGFLHPDASVSGPNSPSATPEYILLWRNSEKPTAPFNLTPFAVTLNDCPEGTLRPYLCPTDCRLRPDQRAFELGKYELANRLKNQQEEHQRATRKAREDGRVPRHKPRWFSAETEGDTGERVWAPVRVNDALEYWIERESVWKQGGNINWKDVDTIFIDELGTLSP